MFILKQKKLSYLSYDVSFYIMFLLMFERILFGILYSIFMRPSNNQNESMTKAELTKFQMVNHQQTKTQWAKSQTISQKSTKFPLSYKIRCKNYSPVIIY